MTNLTDVLFEQPRTAHRALARALGETQLAIALAAVIARRSDLLGTVAQKVLDLLQAPVADLIAEAWTTHEQIHDARERTRAAGTPPEFVTLADATLTVSEPIEVQINAKGAPPERFDITVAFDATIEMITLTITNGCITHTCPATATVDARLSLDDHELVSRTLAHVDLPESHEVNVRDDHPSPARRAQAVTG